MYYKLLFHNPWKVENGKNMSFRPFWHNTVDKQKFGGTLISVSAAPYLGVTCPRYLHDSSQRLGQLHKH